MDNGKTYLDDCYVYNSTATETNVAVTGWTSDDSYSDIRYSVYETVGGVAVTPKAMAIVGEDFEKTYTAPAGKLIDTLTTNGIEVAAAADQASYDLVIPNVVDKNSIVVTYLDLATLIHICGNHGTSTYGGSSPIQSVDAIEQDAITFTAATGYVIAQVATNGVGIAGTLGLTSFELPAFTVEPGETMQVTASFAKEKAWWVAPGLFKKVNETDGFFSSTENMSQFGLSEDKGYLGASRAAGGSSSQVVMYRLADLNAAAPATPAYVSQSVLNGKYFGESVAMANRSVTFVGDYLVGGNILGTVNWSLGYQLPVGGVPYTWQDAANGVVQMTASDGVGPTFMYQSPDGSVYAATYKGTKLGRYTFAGTTLTLDTAWGTLGYVTLGSTSAYGAYGIVGAVVNSQTNVYVCTDSQGVFVVNAGAATPAATLLLPRTVTGRTQNMRITGTADNTPRLIVTDGGASDAIKVFDLAADGMSLLTTTPVATHAVAPLEGGANGGYSPIAGTDDDMYGYLGNSTSTGDMPNLITLRHTDYCPTTATQTVGANGSSTVKRATIYVYPGVNNSVTYTAAAGYRIASLTTNSTAVPAAAGATAYEVENIATDDAIVVTFEQIPATFIHICGNHGTSTYGGSSPIESGTPIEPGAITFTAATGYVIAQVATNGVGIAGTLGLTSFELPAFTVEPGETMQVTASFAKTNAWWIEPFMRNRIHAGGSYSPMGGDIDENEQYYAMARGPANFSDVSGFYMYATADLADSVDPGLAYAGYNTKYLLSDSESFRSVTLSAFYQAVFSVPRNTKHFVGYPFDTACDDTTATCYSVTNNADINIIPGKFSADGMRYYGRNLAGTNPKDGTPLTGNYISMYEVQTNAVGQPQNLVFLKCWNIGVATTELHVYDHSGTDILYVGIGQTQGLRAINTVTDVIVTNALPAGTGTIYSIYPSGIADGTPRLVINDSLQVAVYDMADDMMAFRSTTPVAKYTRQQLDPTAAESSLNNMIPLDDDSRAFNGCPFPSGVGVVVYERKPDTLFVEGHFVCNGATVSRDRSNTFAFGGDPTATFTAPDGEKIIGVKVEGTADSNFTETSYTYTGSALTDYVYVEISLAITRWDQAVISQPAGYVVDGNGNVTLNSAQALAWFSHEVAAGNTFAGKVITLAANVDMGAYLFTPIGSPSAAFGGTFDGGGCTISNLRISENGGFVGLFGYLLGSAVVKNFNIHNADVTNNVTPANSVWSEGAAAAVGGTAISGSVVSNIHVSGEITIAGGNHTAGVVGLLYYGWIYDCTVAGASGSTITGIGTDEGQIGGILGFVSENGYKVVNCHVSDITVTGSNYVGGVGGIIHVGDTYVDCTVSNVTVVNLGNLGEGISGTGLLAGWNLAIYGPTTYLDDCYVYNSTATEDGVPVTSWTHDDSYSAIRYSVYEIVGGVAVTPKVMAIVGEDFEKTYTAPAGKLIDTLTTNGIDVAEAAGQASYLLTIPNVVDKNSIVVTFRDLPYPNWILECGLTGEALTAMQAKYDAWAENQTVTDLMTTDYSAQFLVNADAEAAVALVVTNITLDAAGNVTLAIQVTADDVTLDLAEINGVLYLSTATDLAGTWSNKTFTFTVPANIGAGGIAVPTFSGSDGRFFKAAVGYAAPEGSTGLTTPAE